ncbi:MAG: hypothetical protein NVS9B7_27730 [Flavisolibacter sp.]
MSNRNHIMIIALIKSFLKNSSCLFFILLVSNLAFGQVSTTPDIIWGKLFEEVQLKKIFTDNKTFVDAIPIFNQYLILTGYNQEKDKSSFDVISFVEKNFTMPITPVVAVQEGLPLKEHLDQLWDVLTRKADKTTKNSSLLPLPKPYVVPGGRFREIYYWDS